MLCRNELEDEITAYLQGHEIELATGEKHLIAARGGCYRITENCRSFPELNDILTESLREARNNPNGTSFIYIDDKYFKRLGESRKIESMFYKALENEEFLVYYQPKVELHSYTLVGAEALCRWMHDGEMILPFKFIPVLEHNGDIVELDFYMLDHVCADLRRWMDE